MSRLTHNVRVKQRGSREEVMAGLALKTSGGLTADDLVRKPDGSIASRRKVAAGRRLARAQPRRAKPARRNKGKAPATDDGPVESIGDLFRDVFDY